MSNEELVKQYREGNKKALSELIEQNEGIVRKLAKKFKIFGTCVEIDDLLQEGYIGLIKAADKYDFNNCNKASFITYATHWIYKRLYSFVVGGTDKKKANNQLNNNCTSLNAPVKGNDEYNELIDFIEDTEVEYISIEEKLYLDELRGELEKVMNDNNTLRERNVLKLRYGCWNMEPSLPVDIGDMLEIDNKEVNKIIYKALYKIRNSVWGRTKGRKYRDELIGAHYNYQYVNNSFDEELEMLRSL